MAQMCGDGFGVCPSWRRISLLEADNASLKRQLQVQIVVVSLIIECLEKNFGLSVVNTDSFYFKSLKSLLGEGCSAEFDNILRSLAPALPKTNQHEGLNEKLSGQVAPIDIKDHECVEIPGSIDSAANAGMHFRGPEAEEDVDPGEKDNQANSDSSIIMVQDSDSEIETHSTHSGRNDPGSSEIKAGPARRWNPKNVKEFATFKIRHEEVHTSDRPFKCRYCMASFKRVGHKNEHERIHIGEKSYKCRFCDKWFMTTTSRAVHERIHKGEKDNKDNLDSQIVAVGIVENDLVSSDGIRARSLSHLRPKPVKKLGSLKKNSQRPFKCQHCKASFIQACHKKDHERIHTGEEPYKCRLCDKWFRTTSLRAVHQRTHSHTGDKYNQDQPNELDNFDGTNEAQDSGSEKLSPGPSPRLRRRDPECSEIQTPLAVREKRQSSVQSQAATDDIRNSKKIAQAQDPHKCRYCNASFYHITHTKRHERVHIGEKPYKCRFCSKRFAENGNRTTHERIHTGDKYNQDQPKELNNFHGTNGSQVPGSEKLSLGPRLGRRVPEGSEIQTPLAGCENGQSNVQSQAATNDIRNSRKMAQNPHKCRYCNASFYSTTSTKLHERTHTGEKPYKCSFCAKRFARGEYKVVHERIHTGERPYVCWFCDKGFTQSQALKSHMLLHTNERGFACQLCEKKFPNKPSLKHHEKVHRHEEH